MKPLSPHSWLPLLTIAVLAAFGFALWAGSLPLSAGDLYSVLLGEPATPTHATVVLKIRLPRALLAALVGAALGASGGAFQAVLRNPLADPYILGVSGGAALGAVAALTAGFTAALFVPLAAFGGALGALALVYWVAQAHRRPIP